VRFRVTATGDEISGKSYSDVVLCMADQKLAPVRDIKRYREHTAQRIAAFGKEIDSSTDATFIKTLEAAGMLERC
jgi:hypothetical protein